MPSFRIGFGSDFNLRNQLVGIGTTTGRVIRLEVDGVAKADFNISGVSTLTVYGGFVGQKQNVSLASTIGFSTSGVGTFVQVTESETGYTSLVGEYNTVSEDIIVDEGRIFEVSVGSTVSPGTLESVSIQSHFSVPNGGISSRPNQPTEGMVRFNDDLNTLEFYNGIEWRQFTVSGASGRGVFGGGSPPDTTSEISYLNISSLGNAQDFGNLTVGRANPGCVSSEIRGVWAGGESPSNVNTIDYNTLASGGASADFGDLASVHRYKAGCGSSTRGLFGAGSTPSATNVIEYVEISTTSNSFDFGDLIGNNSLNSGALSSPTRGIFCDGEISSEHQMQFVTIASRGNAVTFGSGLYNGDAIRSCSNSIRGLNAGAGATNIIDYITIATTGNASDFGDLTLGRYGLGATASPIRGIFYSGWISNPSTVIYNTIDYVTIASTGNAIDFGDATQAKREKGACSDSHGGLGGF
jgi:hypothetical protein